MTLISEWSDVDQTTTQLIDLFRRWAVSNLEYERKKNVSFMDTFGFPYTSSSDFAGIWNCQCKATYKWCPEWRFEGLAVSEKGDAIAIFEHEDGTAETLDRYYATIGKVV